MTIGFEKCASEVLATAEAELSDWASRAGELKNVVFDPPSKLTGKGVLFALLNLETGDRDLGGRHFSQLSAHANYAVLPWAEEASEERAALLALLVGALDHSHYIVGDEQIPSAFWQAGKTAYRPGFVLSVPLSLKRRREEEARVMGTATVDNVPTARISGRVTGPGGIPVVRAIVRVPGLNRKVICDDRGSFRLDVLPVQEPLSITVEARGMSLARTIEIKEETFIEIEMDF